jgi:hypothetical protein
VDSEMRLITCDADGEVLTGRQRNSEALTGDDPRDWLKLGLAEDGGTRSCMRQLACCHSQQFTRSAFFFFH